VLAWPEHGCKVGPEDRFGGVEWWMSGSGRVPRATDTTEAKEATVTDFSSMFGGERAQACQFPKIGTGYAGTVIQMDNRQLKDLKTGDPETWRDGSPKKTPILTLDAHATGRWDDNVGDWVDVADDDGKRALFCRGGIFTAIKAALIESKCKPEIGAFVKITFTAVGKPAQSGFKPPKLFEALWTPRHLNKLWTPEADEDDAFDV
jgi:hypothetical protein